MIVGEVVTVFAVDGAAKFGLGARVLLAGAGEVVWGGNSVGWVAAFGLAMMLVGVAVFGSLVGVGKGVAGVYVGVAGLVAVGVAVIAFAGIGPKSSAAP